MAAVSWPEGGLPHGEHPYDYGYEELRDPLPPTHGEPEPGTRLPNATCPACGYPSTLKPFCRQCGFVPT